MQKTSELIWQDAQHQVLFELIERLKEPDAGADVFARLAVYAESHFYLEEEYMRQLKYPKFEEHITAHNRFRSELNDMMSQVTSFDEHVRESISIFLKEWLTRHVLGIDKELEQFIIESGCR